MSFARKFRRRNEPKIARRIRKRMTALARDQAAAAQRPLPPLPLALQTLNAGGKVIEGAYAGVHEEFTATSTPPIHEAGDDKI